MSKVEVNQVTQQCGTTLTVGGGACKTAVVDATTVTLGRCGGTVSLASGATQSGFGRTGTVDWVTTPKVTGDSPITGVTGKGYFLNTTAGTITINLPAGAAGSIVSMADYAATWQTYNVTVNANGTEKIGGVASTAVVLDTKGQSVTLVYVDAAQGWINTMDSTSNVRAITPFINATGGTEVTCGNYKAHIFTGPGTFCVSSAAPGPSGNPNVAGYLVIAGGGAGESYQGSNQGLGGGGGGGFRVYDGCSPATPPLNAPAGLTISAQSYAITVGAGGVAPATSPSCSSPGTSGSVTTFSTISSAGGGGTGGPGPSKNGLDGGSGGGGGRGNSATGSGGSGDTPPTSPDQGFDGGGGTPMPCQGPPAPTPTRNGGGGGGASAVGSGGNPSGSGAAGAGSYICASGFIGPTSPTYGTPGPVGPGRYFSGGGGGAGGNPSQGAGGSGGGTAGVTGSSATDVAVNTGGGGGGANNSPGGKAGNGGSGIIMIRYKYQ